MYALQYAGGDISESKYNTMIEAIEGRIEYEEEGIDGFEVVELDESGNVKSVIN